MKSKTARCIAAALLACLVAASTPSCSKPIDPGSNVPAVYQPLVFILAAVGVGVGIAALTHHNNNHSGGGPVTPTLTTPAFVGALTNQPFDLALDPSVAGSVGALGRSFGAGRYGFVESGSSSTNAGSYGLPSGYQPVGVAIDVSGNDWFVNSAGTVDKCPPPTTSITNCAPSLTFNDALGTGTRSIAADSTHVFITKDNGSGMVTWAAFALDGTGRISGSYTYTGLSTYNQDAAVSVSSAISATYEVFHKDGTSWTIPLPGPATKNSFTFGPVPLANGNVAYDGSALYYGLLGAASSGKYSIGRYAGLNAPTNQTPGALLSQSAIAFNGQSSLNAAPFFVPVTSIHTDDFFIYMLDSRGNLVLFTAF